MGSDADHPDLYSSEWELDHTTIAAGARTGGGWVDTAGPVVYLEITGSTYGEPDRPVTHRILLPSEQYFALMAALEHAGKTTILVENT